MPNSLTGLLAARGCRKATDCRNARAASVPARTQPLSAAPRPMAVAGDPAAD